MTKMLRIFPLLILWLGAGVVLWIVGQPERVGLCLAGLTIFVVIPGRIIDRARARAGKSWALTLTFDDLAILRGGDWLQIVAWSSLAVGLILSGLLAFQ